MVVAASSGQLSLRITGFRMTSAALVAMSTMESAVESRRRPNVDCELVRLDT